MDASTPEQIAQGFEAAWNAHDMEAFGALFDPDATFVNRFASYWRGVEAIVAGHRAIHESVYADSRLTVDAPDVDRLGEDAAVLHVWMRLQAGAAHPAGPHAIDTLMMAVVVRRGGGWRILAAENVTYADPRSGAPLLRAG